MLSIAIIVFGGTALITFGGIVVSGKLVSDRLQRLTERPDRIGE